MNDDEILDGPPRVLLASSNKQADGSPHAYLFRCPGCRDAHVVCVDRDASIKWEWNGDVDRPTFSPSILCRWETRSPAARLARAKFSAEHGREPTAAEVPYDVKHVCHSYVRDGQIEFLHDCTHALAGRTVPLEPFRW